MQITLKHSAHYTLRIAVAMCFIGHGAFGIITKAVWCNYFAVFGIGKDLAYDLMPVVGGIDILMGLVMLLYPLRAIPAWLVIWGVMTAMLRPLSGEPFAEFIERAGNYGAPLAFLLLAGFPNTVKGWFVRVVPSTQIDSNNLVRAIACLRVVVFLLFLGHGWLNMIEKTNLLNQYKSIGFSNPAQVAHIIGIAEIMAAFIVLIKPSRPLLLALFTWKMGSELLYPNYAMFEWIERGGSYGSILALWFILEKHAALRFTPGRRHAQQTVLTNETE